jgi:tetratricopeptide (TPR) repeat protein
MAGRVAWLLRMVVRPACTVAAVAAFAVGAGPWWARLAGALGVVLVRPWRRWWTVPPLVLLAWFAAMAGTSPGAWLGGLARPAALLAPGLVALRALATAAALGLHRRASPDADVMAPVVAARRRLLGTRRHPVPPAADVFDAHLAALRAADDLEAEDLLGEYARAAWCEADARVQWTTMTRLYNYFVQRRPALMPPRPALGIAMRRLVLVEWVGHAVPELLGALTAAATGAAVAWRGTLVLAGHPVPGALPAALLGAVAGYAGATAANPYQRRRGVVVAALALGLSIPVTGVRTAVTLVSVIVTSGVAVRARAYAHRRQLTAPRRVTALGGRVTGLSNYARHRAIRALADRGDIAMAVQALSDLTEECRTTRPALASGAAAQAALLELDRNRLQSAVEAAALASDLLPGDPPAPVAGLVHAAEGRTSLLVGDPAGAVTALRRARSVLRDPALRTDTDAMLARALMRRGEVDEALAVLIGASLRLRGEAGLFALLDGMVYASWARYYGGEPDLARKQAEELIGFFAQAPTVTVELSTESARYWRRAIGHTYLLLGRLELDAGDPVRAAGQLTEAAKRFDAERTPELLGEVRVLQGRCAAAEERFADAVGRVAEGVRLLERRRGELRSDVHRGQSYEADQALYDIALGILAEARVRGVPAAGQVAAALMESMRRGALARTLRDGGERFLDQLSDPAKVLLARVSAAEADPESAPADLAELRADLARHISTGFAAAYLPEEIDPGHLLPEGVSSHVLMYQFFEHSVQRWRGYCVWIPPGSPPWVDPVEVTDPDCLGLLNCLGGDGRDYFETSLVVDLPLWAALATDLLPVGLRAELFARTGGPPPHVVIVPGERLAFLPWPALLLDADDVDSALVRHAVIQLAPSLNVLTGRAAGAPVTGVVGYIDDTTADAHRHRVRLGQAVPLTLVDGREEFTWQLDHGRFAGAYLTAHGTGVGLTQRVDFGVDGPLSTAEALRHRWPSWVVFASCFIGKVEQQTGREPFGLAVACMIGGCRGVVGGVIEVEQETTATITVEVAAAVSTNTHLAQALREAQVRVLDTYGAAATLHQWAGLVCICVELPDRVGNGL